MSCQTTNCDTIQIIEPNDDLIVDVAGTRSDMDERGVLELTEGQTSASVIFLVPKLNHTYNFEYLYVDVIGQTHPGGVQVIPTVQTRDGFGVVFAGSPISEGYVLHWRVTIVQPSAFLEIDFPEDLYLQMPQTSTMVVVFANPRSGITYGFTELRVENLTQPPAVQTPIHVQVYAKTISGFYLAVSPTPPSAFYFLKVRTP